MEIEKINLAEKLALFSEHWRPKIVGEFNGQSIKVVKFQGTFVWHHHEHDDELFWVWRGRMRVEFRGQTIELAAGEMLVVPRGVEHRTAADEEAEVVLIEPAETRNTGNVTSEAFTAPGGVRI